VAVDEVQVRRMAPKCNVSLCSDLSSDARQYDANPNA
jgi:hypothetical protein